MFAEVDPTSALVTATVSAVSSIAIAILAYLRARQAHDAANNAQQQTATNAARIEEMKK